MKHLADGSCHVAFRISHSQHTIRTVEHHALPNASACTCSFMRHRIPFPQISVIPQTFWCSDSDLSPPQTVSCLRVVFVFWHKFYCQYEYGPSAATAYVCASSRRLAGDLGTRRRGASAHLAGPHAQPARRQQRRRCRGGVPAKSWRGPSAPRQSRANGSVRTCSSTNLNSKYHEAAARRAR